MDTETLLIIGAAFFLSAFAKGVTGLGFSTSCLPMLALVIGLKTAMPLVIIPSIVSNIIVMIEAGRFRESLARFGWLLVSVIPGIGLGLLMLTMMDQHYAGAVLGVVLLGYALFALLNPNLTLAGRLEKSLGPVVGFLTGIINGITGSQVMPVLPYLMALRLDRDLFVQAINCSFTFCSLIMVIGLTKIGLFTWEVAAVSSAGLIPVFVGVALGSIVRQKLAAETFRRLVLVMLAAGGLGLIAKAI